jgi:hypothetical protein
MRLLLGIRPSLKTYSTATLPRALVIAEIVIDCEQSSAPATEIHPSLAITVKASAQRYRQSKCKLFLPTASIYRNIGC